MADHNSISDANQDVSYSDQNDPATMAVEVEKAVPTMFGKTLGPYRIQRQIGRGAMGAVYQAEHTKLRRTVAIKVLPKEFTDQPERLARFYKEMEAIGRLDHPNIVRAFDAGEFDDVHYLAMELVPGRDVFDVLQQVRRFDVASACEVIRQTALALQHVSDNHLVHRDIKPSNLLLTSDGMIKLLDLGIARLNRDCEAKGTATDETSMGALVGTPDYMAPEQIEPVGELDIRADVYSLGCTLYTLLSGHPPFFGEQFTSNFSKLMAHVKSTPPPVIDITDHVPAKLSQYIELMMAKDREQRPATGTEIAEFLSQWANPNSLHTVCQKHVTGGARQSAVTPFSPSKQSNWRFDRKHKWSLIGICLAVVTVFGLGPFARRANISENADNQTMPVAAHSPLAADQASNDSLNQIASSTHEIAANTSDVAKSTANIDRNAERMADTLEGLRDAFRMAARTGGILENPESMGEFYHNAQVYQRQGNQEAALQTYLVVFEKGGDFLDVHQRFQELLRTTSSHLDYAALPGDAGNPIRQFAAILYQSPETDRMVALQEFVAKFPTFSPAFFELSRLYSADQLGQQALADKAREKEWLAEFQQQIQTSPLSEYFLDPAAAMPMMEDAQNRWVRLQTIADQTFTSPVNVSSRKALGGYGYTISIAEPAREISYRTSPDAPFESTGFASAVDPATGSVAPNTLVVLQAWERQFEVKYQDVRGNWQGPFVIELGQENEVQDAKRQLSFLQQWADFKTRSNHTYFNLQRIAFHRQSIQEVRYGFNQDEPNQSIVLADPHRASRENQIPVEDSVTYAVVQIVYADGSTSKVRRFQRPNLE